MAKYQIKTLRTSELRKQGADELWIAVLSRAVEDALSTNKYDHDLTRSSARHWFKSYNADFCLVCELAGKNPRYVREKMLKQIGKEI